MEELQGRTVNNLWYRGCGNTSYHLIPSLYRHKEAQTPSKCATLEYNLMTRFKQRSIPYELRPLKDDWETMFVMQHYGVPTRLLDWSENPLTALHFAVMSAPKSYTSSGRLTFSNPIAVWVLDPAAWNRHSLNRQNYQGGPLVPGDEELNGLTFRRDFEGMHRFPVGMYGAHNSPRIVAQQGVFVVFGQDTVPMEMIYNSENFPNDCLIRIEIGISKIKPIRSSLLKQGITESVIFPDLEGLARETRRLFGFND